jgi:DNA modification methylase
VKYTLHNGNSAEILKQYPDNHFDSIVTDPPYGINFLGKSWDSNTGEEEVYRECLRVLKPGGHILAFSAARTYHHLAMALEMAGFEIRDQIMWIYGSGFPKSQDVGRNIQRSLGVKETKAQKGYNGFGSENGTAFTQDWDRGPEKNPEVVCTDPEAKAWEGWGTQLKPAHEPICMARKPMTQSIAKNCQQYGVGALNIDACRVPYKNEEDIQTYLNNKAGPAERGAGIHGEPIGMFEKSVGYKTIKKEITREEDLPQGRFPSNVIMDSEAGKILDEQAPKTGNVFKGKRTKNSTTGTGFSLTKEKHEGEDNGVFDGLSGASKFFYCPKVSRKERHIGYDLDSVPTNEFNDPGKVKDHPLWDESIGSSVSRLQDKIRKMNPAGNNHPTVKPIELMKYLIKLVTPPNSKVLDPFNGSGSTGCAAVELGHHYTGIDLDEKYVEISKKRIEAHNKETNTFSQLFE